MTNNLLNVFCTISGRVQGVGFRAWTKTIAEKYSLTGWVKNCEDGTVQCELSGEKEVIDSFLEECKKGPSLSSVKKIQKEERSFNKINNFSIYY